MTIEAKNLYNDHYEFIDFAKGFSIFTIVLYHYLNAVPLPGFLKHAIMLGGAGVHLFIFLSGFGLFISKKKTVYDFYNRRLIKVLVPYYLFVTFLFIFNSLIKINTPHSLYAYLGHIFLYKMFDNSIVGSYGNHFWFLSTIIQFYLFFPVLRFLIEKIGNKMFAISTLSLSIGYWLIVYYSGHAELRVWNSFFLQYLWEFCAGMICAHLIKAKRYIFWEIKWPILFVIAFLGISLMGFLAIKGGYIGKLFNDIPAFFGYSALVILIYDFSFKVMKPSKRFFIWIGGISYSLYLTHLFVLSLFRFIGETITNGFIMNLSLALGLIPLALIFALIYEKTIVLLFRKYFTRSR